MHPVFSRVLNFYDLCVAGDLFSLPDDVIVHDLNEVLPKIEDIVGSPTYLSSSNDQSVIEMCITRITAAIRDTGAILSCSPALLSLLQKCRNYNLASLPSGSDPPHAKIASDLINCIFLNYSNRDLMEMAVPIGIEFLSVDNTDLARNTACYFSLIAIQLPYLVAPYVSEIVRVITTKGNTHLIRILPQVYSVHCAPVLDNMQHFIRLINKCSQTEKESLLHTVSLVAKAHPQILWPLVGDLISFMNDFNIAPAVVRIFNTIAAHNPVPFLTHTGRLKKAIDMDLQLLPQAAGIFGNMAKLGETVARDCLHYLISRYVMVDCGSAAILKTEIDMIMDRYSSLVQEGKSLLAKQISSSVAADSSVKIPHAKPLPPDMRNTLSKTIRSMYDISQPPPYHSIEFGDWTHRSGALQPSPFNARSQALGKSVVEGRPISAAPNKSRHAIFGSANNVPSRLALASEIASKPLTDGNRGIAGTDLNSKASYQSLLSKGNSRRSLASSGLMSAINNRGSKQSVTNSRQHLVGLGKSAGSFPELTTKAAHLPSLSPVHAGRSEDYGVIGATEERTVSALPTFVVENPYLSKSSEAVNVRSRRNSRHSLAPRPRSRLLENNNQPQVIQVVPIHDAVYQFCERNLEKIRKYMISVFVRFPLPVRCVIEQHKSKKFCKLYFSCQCKGDQCLYATRFFTIRSRIPKVWIHLMFLAIQARASGALNQQDSAVHGLKLCWDHLGINKDFSTLVTSAFPSSREQEDLLRELSSSRYFDIFEYNATIKQWGCFLCNYPERATALFSNGTPIMEGVLKEKKGRWRILKRWRTRYFTLSGPYLSYRSSSEKVVPIDMRLIRSVKAVNGKGIRSIPTVFEIFTHEDKVLLLKAKDPSNAEQWLQSLQIAMAQNHSEQYGRIFNFRDPGLMEGCLDLVQTVTNLVD